MSLLQDDKIRIKYKDGTEVEMPNEGLEALRKVAPEVVERMGYEEGGVAIMIAPKKEMKKKIQCLKNKKKTCFQMMKWKMNI